VRCRHGKDEGGEEVARAAIYWLDRRS
jgi:hypothetical protein